MIKQNFHYMQIPSSGYNASTFQRWNDSERGSLLFLDFGLLIHSPCHSLTSSLLWMNGGFGTLSFPVIY